MNGLIRLRETIRGFYSDYSAYILPVLKFALAIALYFTINNKIGHLEVLNNLFVLIILAAISAILPLNGMAFIGTVLIIGHCFGIGLEVGAFAAVLYILMLLLYFRFVSRDALALLLGPVACALHMPATVPLSLGILRGPESAFSAICALISWRFIKVVGEVVAPMKETEGMGPMRMIQRMPAEIFDKELLLMIIAFAACAVIVSVICHHLTTFTRLTAIIVGSVIYLVVLLVGSFVLDVTIDKKWAVIGTILSALITLVINFFLYAVDYAKTKFIRFEDDDYYFYVKAIPKVGARGAREVAIPDEPMHKAEANEEVAPIDGDGEFAGVDFATKLEDSLKDL